MIVFGPGSHHVGPELLFGLPRGPLQVIVLDSGSGVWSDALWAACLARPRPAFPRDALPEVGCDTATGKGEDYHAIHGRWGSVSMTHSTSNTMDPARIAAKLKEAC